MPRSPHYVFTVPYLSKPVFDPDVMSYMVIGEELGKECDGSHKICECESCQITDETRYHHWQGYVEFKLKKLKISQAQQYLKIGKAHMELREGTKDAAITYCKKDKKYIEYGQPTTQGQRIDLEKTRELISKGESMKTIADGNFGQYCRNYRAFDRYAAMCSPPEREKVLLTVIYGNPGTGKTTKAKEIAGKIYYKKNSSHTWWDGYTDQETVILDEFTDSYDIKELLALISPGSYQHNIKGGTVWSKVTHVIIVSNFDPKDWYNHINIIQKAALLRRVTRVLHAKTPYVKADLTLPKEEVF